MLGHDHAAVEFYWRHGRALAHLPGFSPALVSLRFRVLLDTLMDRCGVYWRLLNF